MIEKRIARRWHAAGGGGPGQDLGHGPAAAGRRTVGKKRRAGGGGGAGEPGKAHSAGNMKKRWTKGRLVTGAFLLGWGWT